MSGTVDYAELFRKFRTEQKEIKFEENMIVFDDLKFNKDLPTNFIGQSNAAYKMQDIWFLVAHRDKPWLKYVQECNKFKFGIVSFLDHKDLLEYLSGNKDKSEFTSKDRGFRIAAPMAVSSAGDATAGMSGGLSFQALASATGGSKRGREDEDEEAAPPPPLSQSESTGASRPYSLGGLDDDEEEAASPVSDAPLTEAQIRAKRRKEETIQRDAEQMIAISADRQMRRRDIDADAEEVKKIRACERPSVTKEELLRSTTRSFKHFLNLMYLRQHEGKNRKRGVTAKEMEAKKQSARAVIVDDKDAARRGKKSKTAAPVVVAGASVVPIILVPPAQTSKISLLNAADLLDKGVWVPLQQKKDQLIKAGTLSPAAVASPGMISGRRKYKAERFVHVSQRDDGTEVRTEFEVVQDTKLFERGDWDRVIAVFTNGKDWEFKGWPLGDPATMFHRVPGFYVAFKGESIPQTITSWKITVLWLEKMARHGDITAQRLFWETVKRESAKEQIFANGIF